MPTYTSEIKSTRNYSYTNILTPKLTAATACHKLTNNILLALELQKKKVPKKTQRCGNKGSPCLDKPMSAQGRGGYGPA